MAQQMTPIPTRNATNWFLLSIFTGIGFLVYLWFNFSEMEQAAQIVSQGGTPVSTMSPLMAFLLLFIGIFFPILWFIPAWTRYSNLNTLRMAKGLPEGTSPVMVILMSILTFLIIPFFVLIYWGFWKWQNDMNELIMAL